MRRDVVRLVTPGTLTEDSLLDQRSHNYLAAVARLRGSGEAALAWADISSGELVGSDHHSGRLAADLARPVPSEILAGRQSASTSIPTATSSSPRRRP